MEKNLIGSRVKISPPFVNDKVGIKEPIVGILEFIGPNKFLGWELQVTVNRMPLQIKSVSQIKILD